MENTVQFLNYFLQFTALFPMEGGKQIYDLLIRMIQK